MSLSINHQFVSAIQDSPDTALVRPSNWNEELGVYGEDETKGGVLKIEYLGAQDGHGRYPYEINSNARVNDLADVQIETAAAGQILSYNSDEGQWQNKTITIKNLEQSFTSQTSVSIDHNLGFRPSVQVYDGSNEQIIPSKITCSTSNITIEFTQATSGLVVYGPVLELI